jgi:hypothetical protein
MELSDYFVIDRLQEKVKKQGFGLKTLMVECLMSAVFRSRCLIHSQNLRIWGRYVAVLVSPSKANRTLDRFASSLTTL